jgi:hypothetical protein
MQMDTQESDVWRQVGAGLGHEIFERFERFEDAVDSVLSGLGAGERMALRRLLERMAGSGEDPRALWEQSGAGIAFDDAKGAGLALEMLLQAIKARG